MSGENGKPKGTIPEDWEDTAGCLWALIAMFGALVLIALLIALTVMAWQEVF